MGDRLGRQQHLGRRRAARLQAGMRIDLQRRKRRQIYLLELDLRNLKSIMELEMLSCKTPLMAVKELWVYLFWSGYSWCNRHQADCLPRELSFRHSLPLWLAWRQFDGPDMDESLPKRLILIAQQRVGRRPDRVAPRALKRRQKPYPEHANLNAPKSGEAVIQGRLSKCHSNLSLFQGAGLVGAALAVMVGLLLAMFPACLNREIAEFYI